MTVPVLFQTIIDWDSRKPAGNPISLLDFRFWRDRRRELTKAAEAYVARQRGSGGTKGAR